HVAGAGVVGVTDKNIAVDLGGVGAGAGNNAVFVDFVDQNVDFTAYFALQTFGGDGLLMSHEAFPALLFDLVGYGVGQLVGLGTFYGRVLETAYAIELSLAHPVEQILEVFFGFAGEAHNKGR